MPVETRSISNPRRPRRHSEEEISRAFWAGEAAYLRWETLKDCPQKYKPKIGDSKLYDSWRHGFLTIQKLRTLPHETRS